MDAKLISFKIDVPSQVLALTLQMPIGYPQDAEWQPDISVGFLPGSMDIFLKELLEKRDRVASQPKV